MEPEKVQAHVVLEHQGGEAVVVEATETGHTTGVTGATATEDMVTEATTTEDMVTEATEAAKTGALETGAQMRDTGVGHGTEDMDPGDPEMMEKAAMNEQMRIAFNLLTMQLCSF